jgi:hypothetical protein
MLFQATFAADEDSQNFLGSDVKAHEGRYQYHKNNAGFGQLKKIREPAQSAHPVIATVSVLKLIRKTAPSKLFDRWKLWKLWKGGTLATLTASSSPTSTPPSPDASSLKGPKRPSAVQAST